MKKPKNCKVLFTEVHPKQKEIDAANLWLEHKQEYLECLSKRHPHYKATLKEIQTIKNRIQTLKKQ